MEAKEVKRAKYLKTVEKDALVSMALNPIYCPFVIDNGGDVPNFNEKKKAKWRSLRENLIADHPGLAVLDVKEFESRLRHEKDKAMKLRREDIEAYEQTGNLPESLKGHPSYRIKLAAYLGPIRGKINGGVSSSIMKQKRPNGQGDNLDLKKLRLTDETSFTETSRDVFLDEFSERSDKEKHNEFLKKYGANEKSEDEIEFIEEAGPSSRAEVKRLHFVQTARKPRTSAKTESARMIELLEELVKETKKNGSILQKILDRND